MEANMYQAIKKKIKDMSRVKSKYRAHLVLFVNMSNAVHVIILRFGAQI